MASRNYHRIKQRELAMADNTHQVHHDPRDMVEGHTTAHSADGKPTVRVQNTEMPETSLVKEFSNYVDNKIQVDGSNYTTIFKTSGYIDFKIEQCSFDICARATLYMTLRNSSTRDWTLPNLEFLTDRTQILWNGNDSDDSWYNTQLKECNHLLAKNVESSAALHHFHPPSDGLGRAFMPKNQTNVCDARGNTGSGTLSYVAPFATPCGIPRTEPLVVPANGELNVELDITCLPLFSGHLVFSAFESRKTRLRVYFNATDSIIGDSTYSNSEIVVGTKVYTELATARQANQLQLGFCELRLHGHRITEEAVRHALHRRHSQSFAFKCLIPRRMYQNSVVTTDVENGDNRTLSSMQGTFCFWTLTLRDTDVEYAPRKAEWYNGIRDITEENGAGNVRDYSEKDSLIFSNVVDSVRFPGGNQFFAAHSDHGQYMEADPVTRGSVVVTTGASRALAPGGPYRHRCGLEKRYIALCFSNQPMKDYWWGTQYGSEHSNGNKILKYTPGLKYDNTPLAATSQNLWINGWQFATVVWNSKDFRVIKH